MEELNRIFDETVCNMELLLTALENPNRGDLKATKNIFSILFTLLLLLLLGSVVSFSKFEMDEFHSKFLSSAKILSHEVTKFTIAHSTPPLPENCVTRNLAGLLCNAASQLIGCFLSLPLNVGKTFLQILSSEIEGLLKNLNMFIETIRVVILKK